MSLFEQAGLIMFITAGAAFLLTLTDKVIERWERDGNG